MQRDLLFQEITAFNQSEFESPASPQTIAAHNTDLDAPYFGGNFNFLYNGGATEATVTFNTYISYRENFPQPRKDNFIANLKAAVAVWDGAAQIQIKNLNGQYDKKITLRFKLNEVKDKRNANKITDVHAGGKRAAWFNDKGREIVMRELNVFIDSPKNVLVHELGHVWGLKDEYETRWLEKKFSPGHVGPDSPFLKDTKALMNTGYWDDINDTGEFRTRYFRHFGRKLLTAFRGLKDYVIPVKHNGKVISVNVQGRIVLLKKDIAGSSPYAADVMPFNPQQELISIAKTGNRFPQNQEFGGHGSFHNHEPVIDKEAPGQADFENPVETNVRLSKKVGWGAQKSKINKLIGLGAGAPPGIDQDFVDHVRAWQNKQRGIDVDGKLGEETWTRMRPRFDFDALWNNYPYKKSPEDVYKLIGGDVLRNFKSDPDSYANACACRLSRALNYAGQKINPSDSSPGGYAKGGDSLNYLYRVKDMIEAVSKRFGSPDFVLKPRGADVSSSFKGKKGIIIFKVKGWNNATGHVTLWNKTECGDHCFFTHDNENVQTTEILFWEFY